MGRFWRIYLPGCISIFDHSSVEIKFLQTLCDLSICDFVLSLIFCFDLDFIHLDALYNSHFFGALTESLENILLCVSYM